MPEIKDKSLSVNVGRGAKAKKKLAAFFGIKKESSSDEQGFIDVKSLSHSQHVELRKSALTFYLNGLCGILHGPESMEDPVGIVKTVFAIYATLYNSFVFFKWDETSWRFQETAEVSFLIYTFCFFACVLLCVL